MLQRDLLGIQAAARIQQTAALAAKARSTYYPTFHFYTEYLRGNAPSAYLFKRLDQRAFGFNEDFNHLVRRLSGFA